METDPTYWTFFLELDLDMTKSLKKVSFVNDNHGQWENTESHNDEDTEEERDEISTLFSLSLKTPKS